MGSTKTITITTRAPTTAARLTIRVVHQDHSGAISFPRGPSRHSTQCSTEPVQESRFIRIWSGGPDSVIYTRTGSNLTIQPIGTQAIEQSTIKYYSGYVSDTWRFRPTLTVNYGLVHLRDAAGREKRRPGCACLSGWKLSPYGLFLAKRKEEALAGGRMLQSWALRPLGTCTLNIPIVRQKAGISPRIAVAWNRAIVRAFSASFWRGQTVARGLQQNLRANQRREPGSGSTAWSRFAATSYLCSRA